MPRNEFTSNTHPEASKRPSVRASVRGQSGYGMDSIRPHLRAQLEWQALMRPGFPPSASTPRSRERREP